jgi:hypothetical protein
MRSIFIALLSFGCGSPDTGTDSPYPTPGQHDDTGAGDAGDSGGGSDGSGSDGSGSDGSGSDGSGSDGSGSDGSGSDGSGSGGSGSDDGGSGPFMPDEGHWTYTGGEIISNGCDVSSDCVGDVQPNEGGFSLVNRGQARFEMTQDGADIVSCDRADKDFSCATWTSAENVEGYDIRIIASLDTDGGFLDAATVMGQHALGIRCEGGDCSLAELFCDIDFPCSAVYSYTAQQDDSLGE